MFTFEPTISWNGIGIVLSNLVVGLVFLMRMENKVNLLSLRIDRLEEAVSQLIKTDSRIAIIEERMSNHTKMLTTAQVDISDLRRGRGWIQGDKGVDHEY